MSIIGLPIGKTETRRIAPRRNLTPKRAYSTVNQVLKECRGIPRIVRQVHRPKNELVRSRNTKKKMVIMNKRKSNKKSKLRRVRTKDLNRIAESQILVDGQLFTQRDGSPHQKMCTGPGPQNDNGSNVLQTMRTEMLMRMHTDGSNA
jgi:hypothetical protein